MIKNLPAMQETWIRSLGREDTPRKEMATCSTTLAWRMPWTEEPGGLQSTGSQSQTRLKWLSAHESKLVQSRVHPWWQTPETCGQRFCLFSLLYNDTMQKHQWRPWEWAPTMWVFWLGRLLAFLGHYLSDFNGIRFSRVFFNLHRFWRFPNILLHRNIHMYTVSKGMLSQASHVFHWDQQLIGRILQRIQFLGSYGK